MSKPYICPVCEGRGSVSSGFYAGAHNHITNNNPQAREQCQACNGAGIVWNPGGDWEQGVPYYGPPRTTGG